MAVSVLLVCGILSSLLYVAMNVFVPMQWEGYSVASQTVSELSAIGAPTRSLWALLGTIYTALVTLFGLGVWISAGRNRPLRIAGALVLAYGVIGLFWPPMHLRGSERSLTDTLHIAFAIVTVLLMMLAIGFGAAAFGKRFRRYSVATLVILVACGALTGLDGPRIAANLPTPWVGVWERINIGVFLLWVVVVAIALLHRPNPATHPSRRQRVRPLRRQVHLEAAALSRHTRRSGQASVQMRDGRDEREAKPGPSVLRARARRIGAIERLEEMRQVSSGDARPRILHGEAHAVPGKGVEPHLDPAAHGRELQRVREQVIDQATDELGIDEHAWLGGA